MQEYSSYCLDSKNHYTAATVDREIFVVEQLLLLVQAMKINYSFVHTNEYNYGKGHKP